MNTHGRSPANVRENNELYTVLLLIGMVVVTAMLITALAVWNIRILEVLGADFNGGPTMMIFIIAYLSLSLKEVGADEVAGAFCYGKALKCLESGLHFLPFGLMQIKKSVRTVQSFQCPGEPETIFKGDDRDALPEGMVRPIRTVSKAPEENEKDALDTRMTLDISFVVQYAILDIFDYIANFGSSEILQKQMRDVGEATIVEEITQNTPASFIKKLPEVNVKLVEKVQGRFQNSGIHVISVRLISPDISHKVSSAFADIPVERAKAAQTEIKAEAEKTKRVKEGEGAAAAELTMLTAQAEGRKKIMEALGISGETVVASEAVRGLSDKTDVLVVGAEGGMKDVMGLVKGAQSALKAGKGGGEK